MKKFLSLIGLCLALAIVPDSAQAKPEPVGIVISDLHDTGSCHSPIVLEISKPVIAEVTLEVLQDPPVEHAVEHLGNEASIPGWVTLFLSPNVQAEPSEVSRYKRIYKDWHPVRFEYGLDQLPLATNLTRWPHVPDEWTWSLNWGTNN